MKRVILAVAMVMGMLGVSYASSVKHPVSKSHGEESCKYKVDDAVAGLKDLLPVGFTPREQSKDGNRVMGLMFYHNPASEDEKSVAAIALILVDKTDPDKPVFFLVIYPGEKKSVVFKREIKEQVDGSKSLSPCFERVLENNPK